MILENNNEYMPYWYHYWLSAKSEVILESHDNLCRADATLSLRNTQDNIGKPWQLHAVLTPRSTLRHMRWERTLDGHAETMPNYNYNFIWLSAFSKKC